MQKGWQGDEDAILDFLHILFQPPVPAFSVRAAQVRAVPSGTLYKKIADSSYQVRMAQRQS